MMLSLLAYICRILDPVIITVTCYLAEPAAMDQGMVCTLRTRRVPDFSGINVCGVRILRPDTSSVSCSSIKPIGNRYRDVKYGCQALWFLRNLAFNRL